MVAKQKLQTPKMALNSVDIKTIYAEDSKLEEKNVNALVKWVENQPHLPKIGGKWTHFTTL